jgi:hypothetical protein
MLMVNLHEEIITTPLNAGMQKTQREEPILGTLT